MPSKLFLIQKIGYNELLQQTVAVIEDVRINIARLIVTITNNLYLEIDKLLHDNYFDQIWNEYSKDTVRKIL